MMPIGPMMIEHRLIERFIGLMKQELERLRGENHVNTRFVDRAIDFIRTYADRCHHGKEEDVLFRELRKKSISGTHERMLDELIEDHRWERETTGTLADASARYQKGQTTALSEIGTCMEDLIDFYPKHIEKEDKHFFLPVMDYFSDPEKDARKDTPLTAG